MYGAQTFPETLHVLLVKWYGKNNKKHYELKMIHLHCFSNRRQGDKITGTVVP